MADNSSSDEHSDGTALVFDMGSGFSKVGFAGSDTPKGVFPTVVGQPGPRFHPDCNLGPFVGLDVVGKLDILSCNFPVEQGIVQESNWSDMEMVRRSFLYLIF